MTRMLTHLEPFRDLGGLQDRINRLFEEGLVRLRPWTSEAIEDAAWSPAVDIVETENDIVLRADLPGVDPKDVDIQVENGTLTLKGERKFEKEVKNESYHRVERSYGSFARSFSLPNSISTEKVKAEFKDGLLTLTLPKREEAKPRTVKIDVSKN